MHHKIESSSATAVSKWLVLYRTDIKPMISSLTLLQIHSFYLQISNDPYSFKNKILLAKITYDKKEV